MKKMLQVLYIALFLGFYAQPVHSQTITVNITNGGTLNGTYQLSIPVNGKMSYANMSNPSAKIQWSGSSWGIICPVSGAPEYINPYDTPTPPCSTPLRWIPNVISCTTAAPDDGTFFSGSDCFSPPLPVALISFTGEANQNAIMLQWKTASEKDNERFEIEGSHDGHTFHAIGAVKGNGTITEQKEYVFNVKNPRLGVTFFRLKQIDFDGKFEYSKTISVTFQEKNRQIGKLYPNPSVSGILNLDYSSQNNDEVISIAVFDIMGKIITTQTHQVSSGYNNLKLDFSSLSKGIYVVKIGDQSQRFAKQ